MFQMLILSGFIDTGPELKKLDCALPQATAVVVTTHAHKRLTVTHVPCSLSIVFCLADYVVIVKFGMLANCNRKAKLDYTFQTV